MKKADVTIHRDGWFTAVPAICVKIYGIKCQKIFDFFNWDPNDKDKQKILDNAMTGLIKVFWDSAQVVAKDTFGDNAKVVAGGRSGGWCEVHGLPPLADWNAVDLAKWAHFSKWVNETKTFLTSESTIIDEIGALLEQ